MPNGRHLCPRCGFNMFDAEECDKCGLKVSEHAAFFEERRRDGRLPESPLDKLWKRREP